MMCARAQIHTLTLYYSINREIKKNVGQNDGNYKRGRRRRKKSDAHFLRFIDSHFYWNHLRWFIANHVPFSVTWFFSLFHLFIRIQLDKRKREKFCDSNMCSMHTVPWQKNESKENVGKKSYFMRV